jgi:hypothetical protein
MIIKNQVKEYKSKKLEDIKPGECFMVINPRLLDSSVGVYMKTDEGSIINLKNGMMGHPYFTIFHDDMTVFPVDIDAMLKID